MESEAVAPARRKPRGGGRGIDVRRSRMQLCPPWGPNVDLDSYGPPIPGQSSSTIRWRVGATPTAGILGRVTGRVDLHGRIVGPRAREAASHGVGGNRLAVLGTVVLALLAGCGGDDEQPAERVTDTGAATVIQPSAETADRGAETADRGAETADRGDETSDRGASTSEASKQAPASGADGPDERGEGAAACEYTAPPGRLGERVVRIELSEIPCDEGRRLALAAAVGQPAGANIPVRRDGFRCDPSTRERGENVTYTCTNGSQSARFGIAWTGPEAGE